MTAPTVSQRHALGSTYGEGRTHRNTETLERRLWDAADLFRANSGPILGIIFLRLAEVCFTAQRAKLGKSRASSRRGSRVDDPAA